MIGFSLEGRSANKTVEDVPRSGVLASVSVRYVKSSIARPARHLFDSEFLQSLH